MTDMTVLHDGINEAANNEEKVDLCVTACKAVQSAIGSDCELYREGQLLAEEEQTFCRNENNCDAMNTYFILKEFKYAVCSVPGRSSSCL